MSVGGLREAVLGGTRSAVTPRAEDLWSVASTAGGSDRDELAKVPAVTQLDSLMFNAFGFIDDNCNSTTEDSTANDPETSFKITGQHVFGCHGIADAFDIDESALERFLLAVAQGMPQNPYHNGIHVLDVVQSVHAILLTSTLASVTTAEAALTCLTAAFIHDLEHKGLTNDYLVRANDEWFVAHKSTAPNEFHHAAAGLQLLKQGGDGCNFMHRCPPTQVERILNNVEDLVLSTDMSQHAKITDAVSAHLQLLKSSGALPASQPPGAQNTDGSVAEASADNAGPGGQSATAADIDLQLVLKAVLKTSDIGHSFAPWTVHEKWAQRIEEEFWEQGDKEKSAKLEVSKFCDRTLPGLTSSQDGFYDFVVLPLLKAVCVGFPECQTLLTQATANKIRWQKKNSSGKHSASADAEPENGTGARKRARVAAK
eukprot:m.470343 g.470343  ORF g.470343 m.470343 type:complete len:428 (+) comp21652_c0_seq3:242-1525(+)